MAPVNRERQIPGVNVNVISWGIQKALDERARRKQAASIPPPPAPLSDYQRMVVGGVAAATGMPKDYVALTLKSDGDGFAIEPKNPSSAMKAKVDAETEIHLPNYEVSENTSANISWKPLTAAVRQQREQKGARDALLRSTNGVVLSMTPIPNSKGVGQEIQVSRNDATVEARPKLFAAISERLGPDFDVYGYPRIATNDAGELMQMVEVGLKSLAPEFYDAERWEIEAKKSVDDVEILANQQGKTVVKFIEQTRTAIVARPDPFVLNLRNRVASRSGLDASKIQLRISMVADEATATARIENVTVVAFDKSSIPVDQEKRMSYWTNFRDIFFDDVNACRISENADQQTVFSNWDDPLTGLKPYDWNLPVSMKSLPFAVGAEDGKVMCLGLLESAILLGGIPGGGKSGGTTTIITGASRLPHTALIGIDPKLVELSLWEPRFSAIAVENVEEGTNYYANFILAALVGEMGRRYKWLKDHRFKKFTEDLLSDEFPMIVTVVDELADLIAVGSTPEERADENNRSIAIRRLIAKGRAAGMPTILATQKPQSDVVPTALRDLVPQRVGYATTGHSMTDTILGEGMSANGGLSHKIAADERGVCYIVNEESRTPRRARTFYIPDPDVEDIALRFADLRIDLPWLPTAEEAEEAAREVDYKNGIKWRDLLPERTRQHLYGEHIEPLKRDANGKTNFPKPDASIRNISDGLSENRTVLLDPSYYGVEVKDFTLEDATAPAPAAESTPAATPTPFRFGDDD